MPTARRARSSTISPHLLTSCTTSSRTSPGWVSSEPGVLRCEWLDGQPQRPRACGSAVHRLGRLRWERTAVVQIVTAAANSASPPSTTCRPQGDTLALLSQSSPSGRCLPSFSSSCGAQLPTGLLSLLSLEDASQPRHRGDAAARQARRRDTGLIRVFLHHLNVGRRPKRPHRRDLGILVECIIEMAEISVRLLPASSLTCHRRRLAASHPQFGEFDFFLGVLEPCVELADGLVGRGEDPIRSDPRWWRRRRQRVRTSSAVPLATSSRSPMTVSVMASRTAWLRRYSSP